MAAIRSVHIENYRCLLDVEIEFSPLTVLVGPNASGKSAVLDSLEPALEISTQELWRQQRDRVFRRRGVLVDGSSFDHTIGVESRWDSPQWSLLRLQLSPSSLREPNQVREAKYLAPTGENLANVFATLPRKAQQSVADRLRELIPLYQDVHHRPLRGGDHRLVFQDRWNSSIWYEASHVSDGTILLLAFLTLGHMSEPPDMIAIEEPEHGIHPYLLGEVVGMLRSLTRGELGPRAVRVILATHSAALLDFVEASEVRFLSRSLDDGSTVIRTAPLEDDQWRAAYAQYEESLGEMWLSGSLGGVPGSPPGE